MALYQLIYLSTAQRDDYSDAQLQDILASAVRHNQADGITGMLLHSYGCFMQLLEGEEAAVKATFARIEQDPRHKECVVLLEEEIDERTFPEWSMTYRRVGKQTPLPPEYAQFQHDGFDESVLRASPGIVLDLLKMFSRDHRIMRNG